MPGANRSIQLLLYINYFVIIDPTIIIIVNLRIFLFDLNVKCNTTVNEGINLRKIKTIN